MCQVKKLMRTIKVVATFINAWYTFITIDCKPEKLWLLVRHGSRLPKEFYMEKLKGLKHVRGRPQLMLKPFSLPSPYSATSFVNRLNYLIK